MPTVSPARWRQALEEGDLGMVRKMAAHLFPAYPQPKTDADAEVTLHIARTATRAVAFKLRAYSHRWLTERDYPSALPDRLRPSAERLYPTKAEAVGISLSSGSSIMQPAIPLIRGAMERSVLESLADGVKDPKIIQARFKEAGAKEKRALFGRWEAS